MKKLSTILFLFALVAAVSGCATTPRRGPTRVLADIPTCQNSFDFK